jgi:hypothetical protein
MNRNCRHHDAARVPEVVLDGQHPALIVNNRREPVIRRTDQRKAILDGAIDGANLVFGLKRMDIIDGRQKNVDILPSSLPNQWWEVQVIADG